MEAKHANPLSLLDEMKDPVGRICLGRKRGFTGGKCEHYSSPLGRCDLLRQQGIRGVFEWGRCLDETELLIRLQWVLRELGKDFVDEVFDLTEFLHGSSGEEGKRPYKGLLEKKPAEDNIISLYAFVNRELYSYTTRELRRIGRITPRRRCGNCKFLPPSEPRMCQLREIHDETMGNSIANPDFGHVRRAHAPVCDGYVPLQTFFEPVATGDGPLEETKGSVYPAYLLADEPQEERILAKIDVDLIGKQMTQCMERAPTDKTQKIQSRFIEAFQFSLERYLEGELEDEAKNLFLDLRAGDNVERDSVRRRLDRDLKKVRKCLSGVSPCGYRKET